MEGVWVTIWLACGGAGAYIAWYRRRSVSATTVGLVLGLVLGILVVAVAQFSLVGVVVAALFLTVWMTLFGLVHWLRVRRSAE